MLLPAEENADMAYSVDPDAFMVATIYVAQGVMDQLVDFFEQTIEPLQMGMRMT